MSVKLAGQTVEFDLPRSFWDPGDFKPKVGILPLSASRVEIHHTGVGDVPTTEDEVRNHIRGDARYHRQTKGWRDLFYNGILLPWGGVVAGRDGIAEKSTTRSLVLVAVGNRIERGLTLAELLTIDRFRAASGSPVAWHRQRARTACPGDRTVAQLLDLNTRAVPAPAVPEIVTVPVPASAEDRKTVVIPPFRPTLRQGAPVALWPWVRAVHTFLGVDDEWGFGPKTASAVSQFQSFFGLTGDGVVGPRTWDLIDKLNGTAQ